MGVGDGVIVGIGVGEGLSVGVGVGVGVAVGVGVGVGVGVAIGVPVGVGVGVGVGKVLPHPGIALQTFSLPPATVRPVRLERGSTLFSIALFS